MAVIRQTIKSIAGYQIEKEGVKLRTTASNLGVKKAGLVIEEVGKIVAGKEKELEKDQR